MGQGFYISNRLPGAAAAGPRNASEAARDHTGTQRLLAVEDFSWEG